jgi:hypothetical protein
MLNLNILTLKELRHDKKFEYLQDENVYLLALNIQKLNEERNK